MLTVKINSYNIYESFRESEYEQIYELRNRKSSKIIGQLLASNERMMKINYSLYLKYKNGEANPSNVHSATLCFDALMNEYFNFSSRYKLINGNYQIKNLDFLIEIEALVAHHSVIDFERYDALKQAYDKVLKTEKNGISYKNSLDLLFEKY